MELPREDYFCGKFHIDIKIPEISSNTPENPSTGENVTTPPRAIQINFDFIKCLWCGKEILSSDKVKVDKCQDCDALCKQIKGPKRVKNFRCFECGEHFKDDENLIWHSKVHSVQIHHCEKCDVNFEGKSAFNAHVTRYHKTFKCGECGLVFDAESKLFEHEKCHGTPYKCKKCLVRFETPKELKTHMRIHVVNKICVNCSEQLSNNVPVRHVVGQRAPGKRRECGECGFLSRRVNILLKHARRHSSTPFAKCSFCKKYFDATTLSSTLQSNRQCIRWNTPRKRKQKYGCASCHFKFFNKTSLTKHVKKHLIDHSTQCNICGKHFKSTGNLKQHAEIHTKILSFPCEICGKAFQTKGQLNCHGSVHETVKDFECAQCLKRFKSKKNIASHMKIHMDNRLRECKVCLKKFRTDDLQKTHMASHNEERPYKCTECDKSFKWSSALKHHFRRHSGLGHHYCNVCQESFLALKSLKAHMDRGHDSTGKPVVRYTTRRKANGCN